MKKNNQFAKSVLLVSAVYLLGGCSTGRLAQGTTAVNQVTQAATQKVIASSPLPLDDTTYGTSQNANNLVAKRLNSAVGKRSATPWYGAKTVTVKSESLPQIFKERFVFNFAGERSKKISLAQVAERFTKITGIPARISQDVYPERTNTPVNFQLPVTTGVAPILPIGSTKGGVNNVQLPISVQQTAVESSYDALFNLNAIDMAWDGSPEGYLDQLTGLLNLSWVYQDGVVAIEKMSSESFDLEGILGIQNYKMNVEGGSTGSAGFANTTEAIGVKEEGKIDAIGSLFKTVEMIIKPSGGRASINEGSGRLIVIAKKDVLSQVSAVVKKELAVMRRQVVIQFDIYSVVTTDKQEFGVDWTGLITDLANTYGAVLTAPASLTSAAAAGLTYNVLKTPADSAPQLAKNTAARYGGSKFIMNSLSQVGDSAKYRPLTMVAKHNDWARKTNLLANAYVSESAAGAVTAQGATPPTLKTSTVTTGDKFLVMPTILDDGSINLKTAISLADLLGITTLTMQGTIIQTPEVATASDQNSIRLRPGESLVITGMSRQIASADKNTLGEDIPVVLGGSKKSQYRRENFLVVVRATPLQ